MSEFEDFEPHVPEDLAGETPDMGSLRASLVARASDLAEPPDLEIDFDSDGSYKGFQICHEPPRIPSHERWPERFYVQSPLGTVGFVPWAGSKVIWPWETAWAQDLHRDHVQSFLKNDKKEKKR